MTKAELVRNISENLNHRNLSYTEVNELCDHLFNIMANGISKDGRFSFPGFGTWTSKTRAARVGRNPQTGEAIDIPVTKTVGFKPAAKLKDLL